MESNVGSRIKEIRLSLNLSQNALAKRAGIGQSTLSAIESTTKSPNTETVRLIADALGVPVSDLMQSGLNKETAPENGDSLKAEGVFILNGLSDDGLKQAVNYLRYLSKSEDTK